MVHAAYNKPGGWELRSSVIQCPVLTGNAKCSRAMRTAIASSSYTPSGFDLGYHLGMWENVVQLHDICVFILARVK